VIPLDTLSTDLETLRVLGVLVSYQQPNVIVEAGTYKGHFAVMASNVAPQSRIHTADTSDYGWQEFKPPNVTFYLQDFSEMLVGFPKQFIDFAFIDSGPPFVEEWEDHVRYRHYQDVMPYMAPGGLIISHDMNSTDWHGADKIIQQASLRLTGGRGITIQQV
jgi:predicted O-methyltransferase YrrM